MVSGVLGAIVFALVGAPAVGLALGGAAGGGTTTRPVGDLPVQAERLPGIGWRYTVPADRGREVTVVVEDRGPRELVLLERGWDDLLITLRLSAGQASVLAALLTGARYRLTAPTSRAGSGPGRPTRRPPACAGPEPSARALLAPVVERDQQ